MWLNKIHKTGVLLLLVVFTAIAITGCGERERLNPFDPNGRVNPDTLHLQIKASPEKVILEWNAFRSPDLTGYNLYRASTQEPLELLTQSPEDKTSYTDDEVQTGNTYIYRMSAVGEEDETALTSPDTVTIGNSWWWVLSDNPRQVSQLSHDGFHVYDTKTQLFSPRYLTIGYFDVLVFVYDVVGGAVYYLYPDGRVGLLVENIYSVKQIVYNNSDSNLLILKDGGNVISLAEFPRGDLTEFEVPGSGGVTTGVVSPDGLYFLASGDSLFRFNGFNIDPYYSTDGSTISLIEPFDENGMFLGIEGSETLQYIIPDPEDSQTGILDTTFSIVGIPRQVVYNPSDNSAWVRVYIPDEDRYSLYRYFDGGFQLMLTGVPDMLSMDVNPVSNECLAASYTNGLVYKITPGGTVQKKKLPFGYIYAIVAQKV